MARVLFLMICLWCFMSEAQNNDFQFKHISSSTGLSQSSVIALEQDALGIMWIGTRDGLNIYDGHNFEVFPSNNDSENSLSSSDILSLKNGSNNRLWVGTYNGLHLIDAITRKVLNKYAVSSKPSIAGNLVYDIEILHNGQVLIATDNGLSVIEESSRAVLHHNLFDREIAVYDLYNTHNGLTYIGTEEGLFLYDKIKNELMADEPQLSDYVIQSIIINAENELYLGTKFNGLIKLDVLSKQLDFVDLGTKSLDVRDLIYDDQGRLWIGTYNGVFLINLDTSITHLKSSVTDENGLRKNSVKTFFKDQSGSIWVGTYNGGAHIWNAINNKFINYKESVGEDGLNNDVVSALEFNDDRVFIATEQGGLNILNRSTQRITSITTSNSALIDNNLKSLQLHQGHLWIGFQSKGVQVLDIKENSFIETPITQELNHLISHHGVYDIAQNGDVIYLSTFGNGLIIYDLKTRKIKNHYTEDSGLSSNFIRAIDISDGQFIWVATQNGLNKIGYDGTVESYLTGKEAGSGIDVLDLYLGKSNKLWVGTKARGLYLYHNGILEAKNLSNDSQKFNTIHGIIEMDGNLWLSTNHGVIEYDPVHREILQVLDASKGLVGNEFSDGAIAKLSNNTIAVGGIQGLSVIPINRLSTDDYAPAVHIVSVNIANSENESQPKYFQEPIDLTYQQNSFSITFTMPIYHHKGSVNYLYRLRGLNDEWKRTDDNTVRYTLQDAGTYIFEVKGINASGVESKETTFLQIDFSPAPWFSWWAYLFYALVTIGLIYAFAQSFKSRTQLEEAVKFEQREQEQIKEANESKLRFFTNISHEFRTPLTLILGPLQQILTDYQGSHTIYKKLRVVESNTKHLRSLIDRLMDFRKLEQQHVELHTAQGNIVKFLKEIYLSFSEHARAGNYKYDFKTTDENIQVYYDRHKLERVFFNLLSNAFKFTPEGGSIMVNIAKTEGQIMVSVQDDGIGIGEEDKEKIFDRFYEVAGHQEKPLIQQQGTGIGLNIVKNIIDLHKGTISLQSDLHTGSTFTVSLLLGRAHLTDKQIITDFKFSDDVSQYAGSQRLEIPQLHPNLEIQPDEERLKILLVEDHQGLRSFMKDLLMDSYKIYQAADGKEAFQIATLENPDLIISDVVMPIMTGTELCSKLKEDLRTSHIPVVLLTSRSSLIYKLEGLENGADDYISKPFDVKEFQLRVHNLLRTKKRLVERLTGSDDFIPDHIEVSSVDEEMLKKAIAIVEKNIPNDQFDIPMFSSELGVSRTMLFIKIKAWTDFTPNEFIQHFRMKRAAQLLQLDKLNISEVSYKVGFKNPKYFSKCFVKAHGETPSAFSKRYKLED